MSASAGRGKGEGGRKRDGGVDGSPLYKWFLSLCCLLFVVLLCVGIQVWCVRILVGGALQARVGRFRRFAKKTE